MHSSNAIYKPEQGLLSVLIIQCSPAHFHQNGLRWSKFVLGQVNVGQQSVTE